MTCHQKAAGFPETDLEALFALLCQVKRLAICQFNTGMLLVPRQVGSEAVTIFYSYNRFSFTNFSVLETFLLQIGSQRVYLRYIHLTNLRHATFVSAKNARGGILFSLAEHLKQLPTNIHSSWLQHHSLHPKEQSQRLDYRHT